MIVVEGCDNTGKTTLIQTLVARFPGLHSIKSPGPGAALGQWVIDELSKDDLYAIYDRFFFSEYVYGPILRGKVCYSKAQQGRIRHLMRTQKPVVIWCSRPLKRIAESFYDREQLEGVADNLPQIEEAYYRVMMEFLNQTKIPYFSAYNYESSSDLTVVTRVVQKYLLDRTGFAAKLEEIYSKP
jgi:thymidylate kinase